jgi:hypothetical protein
MKVYMSPLTIRFAVPSKCCFSFLSSVALLCGIKLYSDHKAKVIKRPFYTLRAPFEKIVDWRQCATLMQREAVSVMSSFIGRCNVVVA